ncbi:N-acetylmuramate alpha-1-phosphate uridylyltransferase [BD1-7 clade bacterium]|uniref:N-acetylmuramate alpha-1-phosphate uridylyltransferase n=1 Tax=BD1-7 clade bacterium TaxID=2029982 RepID=A0A5S9QQ36_9GAMM|nr:N-acetylmuramate alpha-1-phosphate uridylyltransferase [BD1-7 clade bacterium]CAA0121379.1 N-acetylmuramate alpha-1-phosphate uridylyltransferase [BD1-7 clade bacterium]
MKVMLLAAGFGKRMMPLTATCPKPLLTVAGKPLIEYSIDRLTDAGFNEFVINHAYLGEQIVHTLGDGSRWGASIAYSAEGEPLETAGGMTHAAGLLGQEPFAVVNGDIWCDFDFRRLVAHKLSGLVHLVLVANPEHNPEGDFDLDSNGLITNAKTKTNAESERLTYSGIAIIDPALFERFGVIDGPLGPLLRQACDAGLVTGELHAGQWQDIGTPERLEALNRAHQQGV